MTRLDLVVRGGTLVQPGTSPFVADIGVKDGRIEAILGSGTDVDAAETIDARGLHVFPGAVDPHAHIGLGGGLDEYGPDTGAAARGGVTTVFYILIDAGSYLGPLRQNMDAAAAGAHVDYAFHLTVMSPVHLDELQHYRDEFGVRSYKYYMSFKGDEGKYVGVSGTDDGYMYAALRGLGLGGMTAIVHAENIEVVWRLRDELMKSARDDLKAWNDSRPPSTEAEAIYRAAYFANEFSCPLYIVHVSSEAAIREIELDRQRFPALKLYAETCPHYLTHSYESPIGSLGKVNPPLRAPQDSEALWRAIATGSIDTLGSDHVGRRREKKQGSIWKASAGFPGLPTTFLVMLSEGHHKHGVPLERIADLCARAPARIFGLGDRKGDLRAGFDADLVLVDLSAQWTVAADRLGTWSDYSLYDGWTLRGRPRMTISRGRKVVEDFSLVGPPGGEYARPSAARATQEVA